MTPRVGLTILVRPNATVYTFPNRTVIFYVLLALHRRPANFVNYRRLIGTLIWDGHLGRYVELHFETSGRIFPRFTGDRADTAHHGT